MKQLDLGSGEDSSDHDEFQIDASLHESYIKMLQNNVSNEEWNTFCNAESNRIPRDKRKWIELNENSTDEEEAERSADTTEPRKPTRKPSAPPRKYKPSNQSFTLPTRSPTPTPQDPSKKRKKNLEDKHQSKMIATRRSRRVKRKTERAEGEENKRYMRTYRRKERQSRKVVRSAGAPVVDSDLYDYTACIAIVADDRDSLDLESDPEDDPMEICNEEISTGNPELPVDEPEGEKDHLPDAGDITEPTSRWSETSSGDFYSHSGSEGLGSVRDDERRPCSNGLVSMDLSNEDNKEDRLTNEIRRAYEKGPRNDLENRADDATKAVCLQDNEGPARERSQTYSAENEVGQRGNRLAEKREETPSFFGKLLRQHVASVLETQNDETVAPEVRMSERIAETNADVPQDMDPCEEKQVRTPETRQNLRHQSQGTRNHFDGSNLENILKNGTRLRRFMEYRRGPDNLHERPPPDRKDDCQWYSFPGHTLEIGSTNRKVSLHEPLGIRYLPTPDYVPNGLLAALDIFPFANDEERREHHFIAYGVTLATNNRYGKLVYFNGDATIRITEPQQGMTVQVPSRERTSRMRDRLFQMNEFAQNNRYLPNASPVTNDPEGNTSIWIELSPHEIKSVADELSANPIGEGEDTRTYTMEKMPDGTIRARAGIALDRTDKTIRGTDHVPERLKEEDNEIRRNEEDKLKRGIQRHTRSGRDPPASERAIDPKGRVDEKLKNIIARAHEEPLTTLEPRVKNLENENKGQNNEYRNVESIKTKDRTYQNFRVPTQGNNPTEVKTVSKRNGECRCTPCRCSELTQVEDQAQVPEISPADPRRHDEGRPILRPNVPPLDDILKEIAPPIDERKPGLVFGGHFTELSPDTLPPGQHSYLALDAFVVSDATDTSPFVRRGHAYIHLFDSNSRAELLHPRGPPLTEPEIIRSNGRFFYSMKEFLYFQGVTPDGYPNPKEPEDWLVKLNPEAKPFIPQEPREDSPVKDQVPITTSEAVDVLNALKVEVRLDKGKTVKKEEELIKIKEGQHIAQSDEENEPDSNPEPVHYDFAGKSLRDLEETLKGYGPLRSPSYFWTDNLERKTARPWGSQLHHLQDRPDLRKEYASTAWKNDIDDDAEGEVDPGSPPELLYPEGETSGTTVDAPDPMTDVRNDLQEDQGMETDKNEVRKDSGKIETKTEEPSPANEVNNTLERSVSNLEFLSTELDRMEGKDQDSIAECMAQLGLLQVWYDIGEAKARGNLTESDYWKGRVVKALVEKEAVAESLLAIKVDEPETNDDKMDTHQEPTNDLPLIPADELADWYPDVEIEPYAPASPNPEDPPETPYVPESPAPTELEEVKNRIFALED